MAQDYELRLKRSASKDLQSLPANIVRLVASRIDQLRKDPSGPGSKKLRGFTDTWRVRVGDYRIIYEVSDAPAIIEVIAIGHRRDVYR